MSDTEKRACELLADYIMMQTDEQDKLRFARGIKQGEGISSYAIQGDCTGALKYRLDANGIAYIPLTDQQKIFIRNADIKKIRKLNKEALKEAAAYMQDMDISELEEAVANVEQFTDKNILHLRKLGNNFAEVLKKNCNKLAPGMPIGSDSYMYGIKVFHDLALHAASVFSPKSKNDFCKAYLTTAVSLCGKNRIFREAQISCDIADRIDCMYVHNSMPPTQHFIVDAYRPDIVMEFCIGGVEVSKVGRSGDEISLIQEAYVDIDDEMYDDIVLDYMNRIPNKVLIDDPGKIMGFLAEHEGTPANVAVQKLSFYKERVREQNLIQILDKAARSHIRDAGLLEVSRDIFTVYTTLCAELVQAVEKGIAPKSFSGEEFAAVKNSLKTKGIELKDYPALTFALKEGERDVHKAMETPMQENFRTSAGENR